MQNRCKANELIKRRRTLLCLRVKSTKTKKGDLNDSIILKR